jgi:hypothetical protein
VIKLICTGSIFVGLLMGIGALAWICSITLSVVYWWAPNSWDLNFPDQRMFLPIWLFMQIVPPLLLIALVCFILFLVMVVTHQLWCEAAAICSKFNRKGE